jgi:hypothetical protein
MFVLALVTAAAVVGAIGGAMVAVKIVNGDLNKSLAQAFGR